MEAAKLGHKYEAPLRRHSLLESLSGSKFSEHDESLPFADQEPLKKQKLGVLLRDGETEILEGDHRAVIAVGQPLLIYAPIWSNISFVRQLCPHILALNNQKNLSSVQFKVIKLGKIARWGTE